MDKCPTNCTAILINSQTGDSQYINLQYFIGWNELCNFINSKWSMKEDRVLLLLNPIGIKLDKFNYLKILNTLNKSSTLEVWIFNKNNVIDVYIENNLTLIKPLSSPLSDINIPDLNYSNLLSLLTTNLGWLSALEIDGFYLNDIISSVSNKLSTVIRGCFVFIQYLQNLIDDLTILLKKNDDFFNDLLNDRQNMQWEKIYTEILNKLFVYQSKNKDQETLQDLVEFDTLKHYDTQMSQLKLVIEEKFNQINSKLKQIRKDYETLTLDLNSLKDQTTQLNDNDDSCEVVNDVVFSQFKESINFAKTFSRNLINNPAYTNTDNTDATEVKIDEEMIQKLNSLKDDHLSALFKTSQDLYNKSLKLLEDQQQLKEEIKPISSRLYQTEQNIIDLKRFILDNLNQDLKQFQLLDVVFAHMEDLPIVYGLYMIETWRKINWTLVLLIKQSKYLKSMNKSLEEESLTRNKWIKVFGSISSIFYKYDSSKRRNLSRGSINGINSGNNDLYPLIDIESLKPKILGNLDSTNNETTIKTLDDTCLKLLNFIEQYIISFDKLTDNKEIINVLKKRLLEAQTNYLEDIGHNTSNDINNSTNIDVMTPRANNQFENTITGKNCGLRNDNSKHIELNQDAFNSNNIQSGNLVEAYKRRIQKLEALLHEAKYSNLTSWPTTLINESFLKHNTEIQQFPMINPESLQIHYSTNSTSKSELKLYKARELQLIEEITDLKSEIRSLKIKNSEIIGSLNEKFSKISDLNLEKAAYKETMTNLNIELLRLTNLEEELKLELENNKIQFMNDINNLLKENKNNLDSFQRTNQDIHTRMEQKIKILQSENEQQKLQFNNDRDEWSKCESKYQLELEKLSNTNKSLKKRMEAVEKENERLKETNKSLMKDNEKVTQEIVTLKTENNTLIQNKTNGNKTPDLAATESSSLATQYQNTIYDIESKLFNIFKINTFVLENMGLLLTNESTDNSIPSIEIKRVKGLRKNSSHTKLDESVNNIVASDEHKYIQSDVYHKLQDIFEIYLEDSTKNISSSIQTLTVQLQPYWEKIYETKLYEQAIIRRFSDMEMLAKKLTKENKLLKNLLEKYKKEKITLTDFKVGDLALFLPTRENIYSMKDPNLSISSLLTSSFSSVDLSTPPIPNITMMNRSELHKDISKKKETLLEKSYENSSDNSSPLWAIFTAFDERTRYILKMDDKNLPIKNRDWFIGRILTIEELNTQDINKSSHRVPTQSLCYQVTAELVPGQL